ncbi:AAA family ATPase [Microcoleus vaginatus]|uniref:AAA family ATPase n=1 Tax=Microcoleus vaginatus TaxID=119532 RepID=UPI0032A7811F
MLSIPGVTVVTLLYESANSLVYRAIREADRQPIILKLLKESYPTPQELVRYRTEYRITQELKEPGVVQVYDLQKYQNTLVMFVEDFGGESLALWMQQCRFRLEEVLLLTIETARSLSQIHAANVIHKDINPSNIVYNRETGQLKIIDFGISTQLTRENPVLKTPGVLEGTLAYISPEQTGRMNRSLDYRTDFYSLGVTFYELLTGKLPFETSDALELVHCHIAKVPVPPCEIHPEIPKAVSDIVMKLLAKTAEERYQSGWGIQADLEVCLKQLQHMGSIESFPLASQDISDKFQLPQKLYGREREIETLLSAFERASGDKSELMLVAGYSGIGKSALVQELYKPITQKRGYFISGKFDQYQRNIPYSAIVTAFRELVKQLLSESEAQLNQWREKLQSALGSNGQVIIEVIPEVELIIGKQPAVPALGSHESHNRFNLVFQNFIKVFTKPEHPLAIFIDDLHWADGASLKLIKLLMSSSSPALFVIGAYRDNEITSGHLLMLTLDEIAKTGAIINRVFLSPLALPTVTQIISETLKCSKEKANSIAELVHFKTGGNPFFMNEFLKSLYTEGLLEFNFQTLEWQWGLAQIQARDFTDNVVELMATKIQKLPKNTQLRLKVAACIGNNFDLSTLAITSEKSLTDTINDLQFAVAESLVVPLGNMGDLLLAANGEFSNTQCLEYKFVHDRIQQAAYSLITESYKVNIHQKIGEMILKNTPIDKLEEKIFDIVNHLNFAIEMIYIPQKKDELAQLNLIAGKKAKASAAYQVALAYLTHGLKLLATDRWQSQYQITLALYVEAAEAAYLCGYFDEMEKLVEAVLKNTKILLDKVKAYEIQISAYKAQQRLLDAINTGIQVLKLLSVNLPGNPSKLDILFYLLNIKLALMGQKIENLLNLPKMTDPDKLAAMAILSRIAPATYLAGHKLMPIIVLKQVSLSIKYGHAASSPFAYASYGVILCGLLGEIESGYQFGNLAISLLNKIDSLELSSQTILLVNYFIRPWQKHIKQVLQPLLEGYSRGIETGDFEYAGYSAAAYCCYLFMSGQELAIVEGEIVKYRKAIQELQQERDFSCTLQVALNLMGSYDNPCCLIGEVYDERKALRNDIQTNDRTAIFYFYIYKLMLHYLFQNYQEALNNAVQAKKYLNAVLGSLNISMFYLYDALALLSNYYSTPKNQQKRLLQTVQSHQRKMKNWAHHAPMNNSHKCTLIEAELCRVLRKDSLAMDYYDKAIALAKENEYIHEAALAYELAAKFYLSKGKELTAKAYMQEARYCYQLWGAAAKVKDLEKRYPHLFMASQSIIKDTKTTTTGSGSNLDIATVMKAYQAISGEIMLDKLLSSLMKILMENAGAQKGYLILSSQGKLLIEAEGTIDDARVTVLQSIPVEDCQELSSAIVNYVARTQESVVLDDGVREGQFTNDPYIQKHQPKSILCVPLINQSQIISIVYLENNLTAGAFTPERVQLLKVLSGQAAISIQNSQLYTEVRENETRLTQFLEAMPVGILVLKPSGTPYYVNQKGQQLLGKGVAADAAREQLAEVYQVYTADTSEPYPVEKMPGVRALKGESSTVNDVEIYQTDKVVPIEVWGTPIYDNQSNIVYGLAAFQDITERKKAETERIRFTNELFQLNKAYERFVPNQFLHFLEKSSIIDVELGDQVQLEMSVLFSDIRDFTTLSETMTPEENFRFINSYLSRMEPVINENNGFIDKYIGDAIMALFNGKADHAVKAGIAMLHRLVEYNQHRAKSGCAPIQIGIGINTGTLMLGTVGGQNRMEGTVISDAVNLASRVESLTKNYGVSLLITQETYSRLENLSQYAIRTLDTVKVKGKSEAVTVYEVFDCDRPEIKAGKLATLELFAEARANYLEGKFAEAGRLFAECGRQNPGDAVSKIYWERCQSTLRNRTKIKHRSHNLD